MILKLLGWLLLAAVVYEVGMMGGVVALYEYFLEQNGYFMDHIGHFLDHIVDIVFDIPTLHDPHFGGR